MGLFKALTETVKLPFDIAADVITLGGSLVDKDKPYTAKRGERIMRKLDEDD